MKFYIGTCRVTLKGLDNNNILTNSFKDSANVIKVSASGTKEIQQFYLHLRLLSYFKDTGNNTK